MAAAALAFVLFRDRFRTAEAPAVDSKPHAVPAVELLSAPAPTRAPATPVNSQEPKVNAVLAPAQSQAAAGPAEGVAPGATSKSPVAKPVAIPRRLPVRTARAKARGAGESSGTQSEPDPGF